MGSGAVLVRAMAQARGHERMPRRHLERAQHGEIANALLLQRLDESLSCAAEFALQVAPPRLRPLKYVVMRQIELAAA